MARLSQMFVPKDREFFDLFEAAATNVVRGADLLDQMLRNYPEKADLSRDILICEQEGDRITHDIVQRLNNTFVTPIDREDIILLVSALDDIIDLTEEVADYLGLYKIEAPMEQAQRLAHILLEAARQIAEAMPRLRDFKDMDRYTVEIHRLENDGDRIVREGVASLFEGGIDPMVVIRWKDLFERLEGAIAWNLATWWFGLPSSSSHALIGGLVGSAFAAVGSDAIDGNGLLSKVVVPALIAPILAFVVAGLAILVIYRIVGRVRPGPVTRGFKLGQLATGGLLALSHGTNDAQKTMGILALALVAHGSLSADFTQPPTWVIVSAASAIALGTYTGGWRIIKTM